jgi:hypothetical protein
MPKRQWETDSESGSEASSHSKDAVANWESSSEIDQDDRPELQDSDSNIDGFERGEESDTSADEPSTENATNDFIKFCRMLLLVRTLTSKDFCTLMFHASAAGIAGAEKFALEPKSPTGHFQRKIRKTLGVYTDEGMYDLHLPGRTKRSLDLSQMATVCLSVCLSVCLMKHAPLMHIEQH